MSKNQEDDYGIRIFRPGTPPGEKKKGMAFFAVLTAITLAQACFWLFANKVEPILWGMPFGMFTVVVLILLEFATLAALYMADSKEDTARGGDR